MEKKVAVLVVNPVNGFGLFHYLETFFENGISFKTFAVSDTTQVKTNSGISMQTDDVVANLKGHDDEYYALVFACGDAMIPKPGENEVKQYTTDMMEVIKAFNDKGKMMIGHCAAGILFDKIESGQGKKVALHPYAKPHLSRENIGTDDKWMVDGNFYTAQTENTLATLIPELLKQLK